MRYQQRLIWKFLWSGKFEERINFCRRCYQGDSKRAMDEYVSSIFMGGHNTIAMHNTCEGKKIFL